MFLLGKWWVMLRGKRKSYYKFLSLLAKPYSAFAKASVFMSMSNSALVSGAACIFRKQSSLLVYLVRFYDKYCGLPGLLLKKILNFPFTSNSFSEKSTLLNTIILCEIDFSCCKLRMTVTLRILNIAANGCSTQILVFFFPLMLSLLRAYYF